MQCQACKRDMRPLFTSYACDFCDGLVEQEYQSGFIVHEGQERTGKLVYVFRTRTDAARYRSSERKQHCHIREVKTEGPVQWRTLAGNLDGVDIADGPFELFPDPRFEPRAHRAFLVPIEIELEPTLGAA